MARGTGVGRGLRLRLPYPAFQERAEPMTSARMTQFAQRFGFDLPDALARDREILSDFFQRVLAAVLQSETHFNDLLLAGRERLQYLRRLLAQVQVDHCVGR